MGLLVLLLPASAAAFGPLSSFGAFGSGAGQLDYPRAVTLGPDGTAYVAETEGRRVSVFAADGTFVRAMGKGVRPGGGDICTTETGCQRGLDDGSDEALRGPFGVALGPEGRLFVSDVGGGRIVVYDPDGTFNYFFGTAFLGEPVGIEFDRSGLLHVADRGRNRIDVFTPGGAFVRGIGKDVGPGGADVCTEVTDCQPGAEDGSAGAIRFPEDVAFGPAGELVVTADNRVNVFASDGSFLRAFGKEVNSGAGAEGVCTTECQSGAAGADSGAFASPVGVAADAAGSVYVADRFNNRVSVSRIDGSFVSTFGVPPEPFGVALDCRGALYVSELSFGFARVERFGEPGTPSPSCVVPAAEETVKVTLLEAPSNRIRFAGLVRNRRNGSAILFVRVPGPGRLILHGRGIRTLARTVQQARRVGLPVRPKVRLRHFLKKHGKGRIRAKVTFKPTGGTPNTIEKPIVLKRKRR